MNYLNEAGKWLGLPEEESINEDAGSIVILAFFALLFGPDIYEKIKNIKTDTSYVVSDEEIDKIPDYGDKNEKMALSTYAYYKLGINNAEKNTLLYNSNTNINKNVYLYKFNKSKIKLIYNGPFDKLCKKYAIKMKPMNESKLKDREKVYKQTVSLVKQELNKYKELKAKADFEWGKENYNNFINGLDNYITIFYCEVWDVAPKPRSNDPEDVEYTNKVAYEPIQNIINTVNSKLPKDYKLDSWGDWDDLDLTLFYNGKMSEGYNITETRDIKMNYLDEDVKWFGLPKSNNKFSDSELHTLAKLIQKELKPIVNKFNNDSKYTKKLKESLIKNEEFKGLIPKLEYNYELNGSNEIYFVIIDDEQSIRNSIRYVLDDIIKELNKTKIISELSPKISTGDGDEGCIYFIFNRNKCQKYLNESYIFETGDVNMNSINNLVSIAESCNIENSNRLRDDIVSEYTDILESLDTIDSSIIKKDISLVPIYKINEGYAIDLSSLKYVVESEKCTLEEATQKIKDINYIGDTYPLYCVLPEDINEKMTLESFVTMNTSLLESGIIPAVINEKSLSSKKFKSNMKSLAFTFRNFGAIAKNVYGDNPTVSGNFERIRPNLLKLVKNCKSLDDVNYLKRDARAAKIQLTKLKQNRPNIAKQIDAHLKWIETDYMKALNDKAKEIKSKK